MGREPLGDSADSKAGYWLGSDPAHILARSPVAQDLAIPALQFDDGAHPVALELVWHKQRPSGPAATWLRKRFATTKIDMVAGDGIPEHLVASVIATRAWREPRKLDDILSQTAALDWHAPLERDVSKSAQAQP